MFGTDIRTLRRQSAGLSGFLGTECPYFAPLHVGMDAAKGRGTRSDLDRSVQVPIAKAAKMLNVDTSSVHRPGVVQSKGVPPQPIG